jgi:hypothetical protein
LFDVVFARRCGALKATQLFSTADRRIKPIPSGLSIPEATTLSLPVQAWDEGKPAFAVRLGTMNCWCRRPLSDGAGGAAPGMLMNIACVCNSNR